MGRRGSHGQRGPLRSLIEFASPYPTVDLELQPVRFGQGSYSIIEHDHSVVASVNQLQRYRQGLLAPLRSKKGAVQALSSFDDGKDQVSRLSNMLPNVATLMFTATPGELCLRIEDLTAMEPMALRVTMSDLVTEHGQVCLVNGGQEGNVS